MKVTLYCIELRQKGWTWHVSYDFEVDLVYWMQKLQSVRLIRVEPKVPLGWALEWTVQPWLKNLRLMNPDTGAFDPAVLEDDFKRWRSRAHRAAAKQESRWKNGGFRGHSFKLTEVRLAGSGFGNMESGISELARERVKYQDEQSEYQDEQSEYQDEQIDPQDKWVNSHSRLALSLRGRELLLDELQSLIEYESSRPVSGDWKQIVQRAYLQGILKLRSGLGWKVAKRGLWRGSSVLQCERCGSGEEALAWGPCASCGESLCAYCTSCLTMGRVKSCSPLFSGVDHAIKSGGPKVHLLDKGDLMDRWGLSPAQREAVSEGLEFLKSRRHMADKADGSMSSASRSASFLIWAVTGAGKTEMIFPLIDSELYRGGRVLIATPRKDVIIELEPRVKKAFPERSVVTLYGGSSQRWEQGEITLATTHQLLRFRERFDFVVIDELDAFPFHNNPMLDYAASKAVTKGGSYILLSATPPKQLQREAHKGLIPYVKVPVRYHRHPLPVPVYARTSSIRQWFIAMSLPRVLIKSMNLSIQREAQCFIFIPKIQWIEPLVTLFGGAFPDVTVEGTSSKDPKREEKVRQFRQGLIRLLLTTTILERGVTVPRTDVFILDSDSELFDASALVQMAGRAGRSANDPNGLVWFVASNKTEAQREAIQQIKQMNHSARIKGYLL